MQPEFDLEVVMLTAIYLLLLSMAFGKFGAFCDEAKGPAPFIVVGYTVGLLALVASIYFAFPFIIEQLKA